MRIAIINLTGGRMSGGYRKYLINVLPKMAMHSEAEAILCASPLSIDIQNWFNSLPKVIFITCKSFKWKFYKPDNHLIKYYYS